MPTALQKGIESAKAGHLDLALSHLKDAIIEEPENANVWVWLAAIIEDDTKQAIFLKKALEIDPDNRPALRGMTYLERKKTVAPKPNEKLSDYTRPIGLFKKEQEVPRQAEPEITSSQVQSHPSREEVHKRTTPIPVEEHQGVSPEQELAKAKKKTAWLDVILYTIILLVFIVIGLLIGSTLLKIELPFLSAPKVTIEVPALPESAGVYLLDGDKYLEMRSFTGVPDYEDGIPATANREAMVLINNLPFAFDSLVFKYEDGKNVQFSRIRVDGSSFFLIPGESLLKGLYCLIDLNSEGIEQSQFWCLRINE